jgi:uncharacterized protein (TIGR02145 family)
MKLCLTILLISTLKVINAQLIDIDGNTYNTVVIGNQIWMAENLKVTKFQNGDPIPNVTDGFTWQSLNTPAYCYYNNDVLNNSDYGKLYNWYVVQDLRNVCPIGWKVPTESDFNELITYLDPNANNSIIGEISQTAGGVLKEVGLLHWNNPNTGATNATGFTGLPGGTRENVFYYQGGDGFYWTNTSANSTNSWYRGLHHTGPQVSRFTVGKFWGLSIRCMKNCTSTSSSTSINTCGSYTAPDGQVYTQSGVYTAVIANNAGCDSTITINLTLSQNTTSNLTQSVCETFTAPDGQVYNQTGVYTAIIPNIVGCDSIITINLTVGNINTGVTINNNTLVSNENGAQYQWIDCTNNQFIQSANGQAYSAPINGDYAVIVTNQFCSDTSECFTINNAGIDSNEIKYVIYPNPATDQITINGEGSLIGKTYLVFDQIGKVVYKGSIDKAITSLSVTNFSNGVYTLQIDGQGRRTFVVRKE